MSAKKKRILIAIDGSVSSMDAVGYSSRFFDPQLSEVSLMHINQNIPKNSNTEKADAHDPIYLKMEEYSSVFERQGFNRQAVHEIIRDKVKGVASDIIAESEKGYNALVIGRRGLNDPTSIIVGATAYRMLKAIKNLPVVIVGEQPDPEHILIGLDGSQRALETVDCVCELMSRPSRKAVLCHILYAEKGITARGAVSSTHLKKELSENQPLRPEDILQQAEDRLIESGFERSLVKRLILKGIVSRAVAIRKPQRSIIAVR